MAEANDTKVKDEAKAKKAKGMTPKRVYFVMLTIFCVAIVVALGAVYMGDKMLKKRADTLTDLKLQNHLLDEQQNALSKAQKELEKYADFDSIAKSIVPQDKDQAKAVRQIIDIAQESGITIESISFPASSLGTATATPVADASGKLTTPSISQAIPVKGINGVYSVEMEVKPHSNLKGGPITYDQMIDFLSRLESNRRTSQVTKIHIIPINTASGQNIGFILDLKIFLKP